jgi:hypothetical protein
LFLSIVVIYSTCVIAQTRASSFIDTRIVDSIEGYGTQSSLALDSKGNPHISYDDNASGKLMYASWTGSIWILQIVDTNGAANPSIALDFNDNPHICYTRVNMTGSYLMYAEWTSSGWSIKAIDSAQNANGISDPSLKLDAKGFPHIGYVGPADALEYAVWTGSDWNMEIIDPWTERVTDPSLALDSNGKPWISYFDPTIGLKCVSWTGSGWNKMIVDTSRGVGKESSIAVDSRGNPHISYDDDPLGNLKYARWTGSTWDIQIVDRNKRVSLHSSLALDSAGNPHISYDDNANGNLMYAKWTGSMWTLRIVDQIKGAPGDLEMVWGHPTSLALDTTGTAHISYCGYTRHDLKYAAVSDSHSFLVTFNVDGVDSFDGKVLEVDSIELALNDLPKSFVWRAGSSHSFEFVSVLELSSGGKLFWASTSGLATSQSDVLTVSKEGIVTANYETSSSNENTSASNMNYIAGLAALVAAVAIAVLATLAVRKKKSNV